MKLNHDLFWRAFVTYRLTCGGPRTTTDVNKAFRHFVGITEKQWLKYIHKGTLKVRPKTHALLLGLSNIPCDSPHFKTLIRTFEIRHGKEIK